MKSTLVISYNNHKVHTGYDTDSPFRLIIRRQRLYRRQLQLPSMASAAPYGVLQNRKFFLEITKGLILLSAALLLHGSLPSSRNARNAFSEQIALKPLRFISQIHILISSREIRIRMSGSVPAGNYSFKSLIWSRIVLPVFQKA